MPLKDFSSITVDFNADLKELTSLPQGPTGLEAWPDILVRHDAHARRVDRLDPRARDQGTEVRSPWPAT